jgi:predicted dehydrogenase
MKNELRFCLVGRGSIGTRHLKNLKSLSCNNIVAFSEFPNKKKDEEFQKRYDIETLYSLEDLRRYNPGAFVIANPTSEHLKVAKMALEMESHIFMEKPISNTLAGIEDLRNGMLGKNIVFFLANNLRFHPALIKIKQYIEDNKFGDVYFARIMAGQYLLDWHPWEDYRQSYSARKALGGGVVLTLQHEIDYAYWLFGKFKGIKSSVKKISDLEIDVEDVASIIIETESGTFIEIHLDYLQRPPKRTIQVQGSKGSIDYRFGDESLQFYDFDRQTYNRIHDLNGYDNNQTYIDEMKHFIKCLSGEERPKSGIEDAVYVLKTCLEIKKEFAR